MFLSLAAEEQDHETWLRGILRSVLEQNLSEENLPGPDLASPGVFRLENLKNAGSLVVSALHIVIMMEKESFDFYQDAAARTQLPEANKTYLKLAQWELRHLQKLEEAYDFAKEEWWSKQGFSPV